MRVDLSAVAAASARRRFAIVPAQRWASRFPWGLPEFSAGGPSPPRSVKIAAAFQGFHVRLDRAVHQFGTSNGFGLGFCARLENARAGNLDRSRHPNCR